MQPLLRDEEIRRWYDELAATHRKEIDAKQERILRLEVDLSKEQ